MKILIALMVAALFILLLKVFKLAVKQLQQIYSGLKFADNIVIGIEFLLWLGYSFCALYYLFREKFFYRYLVYALVLIVIVFLSWFLLRDIFAGIIFRIKHNLRKGSFIKAGDFSGQIKSLGLTCLEIITSDKRLLRVPYIHLVNAIISESAGRGPLQEQVIRVKIDESVGRKDAESHIRTALLNIPWSKMNEEPSIKYKMEDKTGYFYDIILVSKNIMQLKNIEKSLEQIDSIQVI